MVEKAAIYRFYQSYARGARNLVRSAEVISGLRATALTDNRNSINRALRHFGEDFEAQLRRSGRKGSFFIPDFDSIIQMSEGLPRVFLTVMKHIFDWTEFETGALSTRSISPSSIRRGLLNAAEWFQTDMPQAGMKGEAILLAIARLAELFRINRYSDKPTECSLIAFSTPIYGLSERSMETLKDAELRSFLIRVPSNDRDRNTKQVRPKYQLNRILCPLFGLPISRRGTARLDNQAVDTIFGGSEEENFAEFRRKWRARRNWPFGRRRVPSNREDDESQIGFVFE